MKTVEELNELTQEDILNLPELTDDDDATGLVTMGPHLKAEHDGDIVIVAVAQNAAGQVFRITTVMSFGLNNIFFKN